MCDIAWKDIEGRYSRRKLSLSDCEIPFFIEVSKSMIPVMHGCSSTTTQ